ncbi:MAG TPA: hypothetical protein VMX94_11785 [Armatimonadota bacterium]|nr:hypothetical protein [Armatimonadota bacterium]
MSVKATIKCNCGQRIISKDVMQTGYYLRLFGPSFVYVKFRCSRCKKLGEQFIKQEDWEDGILKDIPSEVDQGEREKLEALGPINVREQIAFHFGLENADPLAKLNKQAELQASGAEEPGKTEG